MKALAEAHRKFAEAALALAAAYEAAAAESEPEAQAPAPAPGEPSKVEVSNEPQNGPGLHNVVPE